MSFADASAEARRAIGLSQPHLPSFIPAAFLGKSLRPVTTPMQALQQADPFLAPTVTDPSREVPGATEVGPESIEMAAPLEDPFGRLSYLNDNGMAPAAGGFSRLVAAASLGSDGQAPSGQEVPLGPSNLPLSLAELAPLTPDFEQPTEPPPSPASLPLSVAELAPLTPDFDRPTEPPQDPASLPLSLAELAPLTPDFDRPTEPPRDPASLPLSLAELAPLTPDFDRPTEPPQDPASLPLSLAELAPLTPDFDQPTEPPAEPATERFRFTLYAPDVNQSGGDATKTGTKHETSLAGLRVAALGELSEADAVALPVPEEAALAVARSSETEAPEAALPAPLKPLPLQARLRPEAEPRAEPEPRTGPSPANLAALVPQAESQTAAEAGKTPALSLPTTMVARKLPNGKIVPFKPLKTVTPSLSRQAPVRNEPQQTVVEATPPQQPKAEQPAPRPRVAFPQTAHLQPGLYAHATPRRVLVNPRQALVPQAPAQQTAQPRVLRLRLAAPPKPARRPFSAENLEIDLVPGSKADRLATFLEGVSQAEAAGQGRGKQPVPFARVVSNATQARSGTGLSLGHVADHTISRNEQARRQDMVRTLRSLRTPSGLAF